MLHIQPLELHGQHASLVPLSLTHHDDLVLSVQDGELWNLWYTFIPRPEAMRAEIERRLALQAQGSMLPFAVLNAGGQAVGMTTCMHIDAPNHRLEIGSEPTGSTRPAAVPSSAWGPSSTGSCARTKSPPMAACATPVCTASSPPSGRR